MAASYFCRMKLICLMENLGKNILTFILKCGTDAPTTLPGIPLHEYLNQLTDTSTANYVRLSDKEKKKPFNPSEMHQINKYPLWDKFDISLLFKAIKLTCEGVAKSNDDAKWKDENEMEGLIKKIKDERNNTIHEVEPLTETEFQDKVMKLENLFVKTLDAAKTRYNVPDVEFTSVKDKALLDISKIRQMEKEISKEYWAVMLPNFIHETQKHLKDRYQQAQYFDPLSFLSNSPQGKINIQSVFCKAFLIEQKQNVTEPLDIDSCNILTLTQLEEQSPQLSASSEATQSTELKSPQLIMIKGVAGSGKTTLLTFILAEWLKDSNDCSIKHLNEFDIVLRILCRENDGPLLKDFLKQVLPDFLAAMDEYLVILLKKCKVLFLIDGLDELSRGSPPHKLVKDIMNIGKDVHGFTIICTSRPESVDDFLKTLPASYQQWKMGMKGVSREDRTEFALRHYDSLPPNSSKDHDRFRHLMDDIGWRDHYELPLNLLFVATLFYTEPDCKNTTQTSLYLNIHQWCVQKLQSRLADHPEAETDHLAREDSISRVLSVIYEVALQGLLQDRLILSQDDTRRLRDSCRAENLPSKEVMGAFLCLRETIVRQVSHQKYSAPHKSIQEFYGAKHIIHKLLEDSHLESIQSLLHDPSLKQLCKLQNLLLHVAGLLSQPDMPFLPKAIQEVVDLLAKTGMKNCNDWLSLLEDTDINRTALECVARHIKIDDKEEVTISDSTFMSAKSLLPLISPKKVQISVQRGNPDLRELVCKHHTYTRLWLRHHYRKPHQASVSDSILCALPRNSYLKWFAGHQSIEGILLLKEYQYLKYLQLAVSDEQTANKVLSAIMDVCPSLPKLQRLALHVPVLAVTPGSLTTRLPDITHEGNDLGISLVMSGVDKAHLDWTWQIAEKLQPAVKGYWAIQFPSSNMKTDAWNLLLDKLAEAKVRVKVSVRVPDTTPITKEEMKKLSSHAKASMLGGFVRMSEDHLWLLT